MHLHLKKDNNKKMMQNYETCNCEIEDDKSNMERHYHLKENKKFSNRHYFVVYYYINVPFQ